MHARDTDVVSYTVQDVQPQLSPWDLTRGSQPWERPPPIQRHILVWGPLSYMMASPFNLPTKGSTKLIMQLR